MKTIYSVLIAMTCFCAGVVAQPESVPEIKEALKENRARIYNNIVTRSITKNLSLVLNDSTEEYWQDAFYALELVNYRSPWVEERVKLAFDSVEKRSTAFQRALLELAFANYKGMFARSAFTLMQRTRDPKIFAMAAEYYLAAGKDPDGWSKVLNYFSKRPDKDKSVAAYYGLLTKLIPGYAEKKDMASFIRAVRNIAPGQVLLISFQRRNRDYPGLVVIREANGNFIRDENNRIFSVPQLARSINNLPFYLTSGNTPQGLFRITGFDVSKSMAIGPTTNIQLVMPYETSPQYFLGNASIADTTWTEEIYKLLLPESLREYLPLCESFYASKAGRTEIIAHGTTVNPEYYKGMPFYPLTPTEGCLCTRELWSTVDGKRVESDQQKLVNALKAAGGSGGYCVVVELDDQQRPVSLTDILPYLK